MPRAGLRRHALAARLAGLLPPCNKKKPPEKVAPKIARLGPPQAERKKPKQRAAGGRKIESLQLKIDRCYKMRQKTHEQWRP